MIHRKLQFLALSAVVAMSVTAGMFIATGLDLTPRASAHPATSDTREVPPAYHLPNFAEQEVVAIDLTPRAAKFRHEIEASRLARLDSATVDADLVNPVPRAMLLYQNYATRILSHGGVFVVFAAPRDFLRYRDEEDNRTIEASTWDFIDWNELFGFSNRELLIQIDPGNEIALRNIGKLSGRGAGPGPRSRAVQLEEKQRGRDSL